MKNLTLNFVVKFCLYFWNMSLDLTARRKLILNINNTSPTAVRESYLWAAGGLGGSPSAPLLEFDPLRAIRAAFSSIDSLKLFWGVSPLLGVVRHPAPLPGVPEGFTGPGVPGSTFLIELTWKFIMFNYIFMFLQK